MHVLLLQLIPCMLLHLHSFQVHTQGESRHCTVIGFVVYSDVLRQNLTHLLTVANFVFVNIDINWVFMLLLNECLYFSINL